MPAPLPISNPQPQDKPRLHDDEISVSADDVRELLRQQAPHLAALEPIPVASAGTSNWLFRLGPDLVARLPRRPASAEQLTKEHTWLPRLAPHLPVPIPAPLVLGQPTARFPFSWSVLSWIEGRTEQRSAFADSERIAVQLAGFLGALQRADASGAPEPGDHNSWRGAPLELRNETVRACTLELEDAFDPDQVLAVWDQALAAPMHTGPPQWLHGDLLPSNLLLGERGLAAVIDFGLLGAGDPACDLLAAWALFDADARAAFRDAMRAADQTSADSASWTRGRGWALSFAVIALPYYRPMNHPLADVAAATLRAVLADGPN